MNILLLKKLTKRLLFTFFFINLLGCEVQNSFRVKELCTAIEVDSNFVHSESSLFEMGSQIFSFRQKAIYDLTGMIEMLIVYKSDGIIEYSQNEIKEDMRIIENADLPGNQSWIYNNGNIIKGDSIQIRVESLDEKTFVSKENGKIIIYKLS